MNFMVGGRRVGKTTRLLQWAQEAPEGEHRIVVSMSGQRAMELLRLARQDNLPLESWQFVGYDEVVPGTWPAVLRGRGGKIVLGLDDLDTQMRSLFAGYEVGMITATGAIVNLNTPALLHEAVRRLKALQFVGNPAPSEYFGVCVECKATGPEHLPQCQLGLFLSRCDELLGEVN